jgi:orotidine-5'-phosphate decarboxylase
MWLMSQPISPQERLIVALDVPTIAEAIALVEQLAPLVSIFKIGFWLLFKPELPVLIAAIFQAKAKFFLDAKLNDIPETVKHGVMSAADRGASFITVHGDEAMLTAAMAGKGSSDIKIMAVAALTSLSIPTSRDRFRIGVLNAVISNVDGLIMSPSDLLEEWQPWPSSMIIATPGVRMAGESLNDHQRAGSPDAAIRAGADYLIVGRPIILAGDPVQQAQTFIDVITAAQQKKPIEEPALLERIRLIVNDVSNIGRNGALRANPLQSIQRMIDNARSR